MSLWDKYAPFVHYLEVGPLSMTPIQYRILLSVAAERPLLPSVCGLFMCPDNWPSEYLAAKARGNYRNFRFMEVRPFPTNWVFAMHLVMLAIGPSLRTLELCFTGATIPDFDVILRDRAPLLSDISLNGAPPDFEHRPCNSYLCSTDDYTKNLQKRLGYSRPEKHHVYGGNGSFAVTETVSIIALVDRLPTLTAIRKLTLDGPAFQNTDLFSIGDLPSLHTLALIGISIKDHSSNLWGRYASFRAEDYDEDYFPALRHLLLAQVDCNVASYVFSVQFMMRRVQSLNWELPKTTGTTRGFYTEALEGLSHSAHSLGSLDLSLPECTDAPEYHSDILQVAARLWPGGPAPRLSASNNAVVVYKRRWIPNMMM
ncbi:hypothetical protein FRC11_009855 [Ceratobasidium sp. 423]|nr:hypothetical protein FRC11_009855 [Ceratobasidium sp. 423]